METKIPIKAPQMVQAQYKAFLVLIQDLNKFSKFNNNNWRNKKLRKCKLKPMESRLSHKHSKNFKSKMLTLTLIISSRLMKNWQTFWRFNKDMWLIRSSHLLYSSFTKELAISMTEPLRPSISQGTRYSEGGGPIMEE